jgi:transposase
MIGEYPVLAGQHPVCNTFTISVATCWRLFFLNKRVMSKVNKKKTQDKFAQMPIVHLHAAGIDVGSRSHFVAVGQNKEDVKEYGVYTEDLHQLCQDLVKSGITDVALESTGSYWQPLFVLLQQYNLNPILVNGKFTKNVKGKKTDVKDSQWIQKLHTMGMLEGSFIPDLFTETVRQYNRHRECLIESAASYINKMQKALRLTNIRLDAVLRDVMGMSGKAIIEAILGGERNPAVLASLAHPSVKTPKAEIKAALTGDWREEYIFELRHCYEFYKYYHQKIDECDTEIKKLLTAEIERKQREEGLAKVADIKVKKKKVHKNSPNIDMQRTMIEMTGGIDISAIKGVGLGLLLCLIAETGIDLKAFATDKQFASWLRLSPDTKVTGGKIISDKTRKGKNRLAHAFMHCANTIGNMKEGDHLVHFFKRIARKKDRIVAMVATARKLAVIVWNMLVKKKPYNPEPPIEYLNKIRANQVKNIQRKIHQLNIKEHEFSFAI